MKTISNKEINLEKIRNIVFDYGGVIVDLDRDKVAAQLYDLGIKNIEEVLSSYHQKGVFDLLERGVISSEQFRDEIRYLSGTVATNEHIDNIWKSFLVGIDRKKLEIICRLKQTHNVYLLSNTNPIHWEYSCNELLVCDDARVDDMFTHTYRSYMIGLAKPDIKVYEYMVSHSGMVPSETLFIDDSMLNCEVAEKLGINSFYTKDGKDWLKLFEE
ncbi:MAG: HAD family phosphatase [Bacteroides sp.]|nr:HAD family phosphatase [Bacteroides sp.]